MKALPRAVSPLLVIFACTAQASEKPAADDAPIDEIIVAEHALGIAQVQRDLASKPIVDTAGALKTIPGADVNQNGLLTGIAQYRGMYGDRVATSIDNHAVISGGPNAMDAPLSYVSPMIAESIVVDRGIASVSSAPESIGGHIATSLDRGRFGGEDFSLSGFVASRYSSNANLATSASRLTLSDASQRISLLVETDNGNDLSTPQGVVRPSRLHRDRYDLSYGLTDGENHLVLFAGRLATQDSGTPALAMDILNIDTDLYGAHFLYSVSPVVSFEGGVSSNDVEHSMDNFSLRTAPPAAMQRLNQATGDGTSFTVASILQLNQSTLRIGLDGIKANHDSTISNPNNAAFRINNFVDVERDVFGAFAEWKIVQNASLLELGMRLKRVQLNAGEVSATGIASPAATLLQDDFNASDRDIRNDDYDLVAKYRYQGSEALEWTIEVARKSRAPSYQEMYLWLPLQATGGLADGRTYIGDVALESEYANEINIGATFSSAQFSVSPQVYVKEIDGYIQGIPSSNAAANMMSTMMTGKPALQFANTDATIWGTDIAWTYRLSEQIQLDGAFSYVRGERTDIDDNLYRLMPANANFGMTWQRETWSLGARVTGYAGQDHVSATNEEAKSGGYALLSSTISWQPNDTFGLEAHVHNLLDRSHADHLAGINRAMGSDIAVGSRIPGTERTLIIGAKLSF